jgi:hypothetical protein
VDADADNEMDEKEEEEEEGEHDAPWLQIQANDLPGLDMVAVWNQSERFRLATAKYNS